MMWLPGLVRLQLFCRPPAFFTLDLPRWCKALNADSLPRHLPPEPLALRLFSTNCFLDCPAAFLFAGSFFPFFGFTVNSCGDCSWTAGELICGVSPDFALSSSFVSTLFGKGKSQLNAVKWNKKVYFNQAKNGKDNNDLNCQGEAEK